MGLLNDLFPKTLELVPRAVDRTFDAKVKEAALELGYQPDETFCLKISQLRELFVVRWSVFLLGPAGGKLYPCDTLNTQQRSFEPMYAVKNPVSRCRKCGSCSPCACPSSCWDAQVRDSYASSCFRTAVAAKP